MCFFHAVVPQEYLAIQTEFGDRTCYVSNANSMRFGYIVVMVAKMRFQQKICEGNKVSDVLRSVRDTHPHTLEAVDITDDDKAGWYDKYKYDIPVLHMNGKYWAKHRLTAEVAIEGLEAAKTGTFQEQVSQSDAGAMERQQAQHLGS